MHIRNNFCIFFYCTCIDVEFEVVAAGRLRAEAGALDAAWRRGQALMCAHFSSSFGGFLAYELADFGCQILSLLI